MSVNTWTPTALASEARAWQGRGWRAVEAQHQVASMALVQGRLADQALLEEILDAAKPPPPQATAGLHWLLATPFRYPPPTSGSRFRRRFEPGVFYGAEDRATACAEAGFGRLQFWLASKGLAMRQASLVLTVFEFHASTSCAIDLCAPPFAADRSAWKSADDYTQPQALAATARSAEVEVIRYESARRDGGICLALLTPHVFKRGGEGYRQQQQTWSLLLVPPARIVWQRHLDHETLSFTF